MRLFGVRTYRKKKDPGLDLEGPMYLNIASKWNSAAQTQKRSQEGRKEGGGKTGSSGEG